jgi:predicted RNA-binding protein with EMAP domain
MNNKNFVSMVNMINNISSGLNEQDSLNEYLTMLESVQSFEEGDDLEETEMTKELEDKREEYVLELKKKSDYFKKRYGDDWENVMYGTATNLAKRDLGM